MPLFIGCSEGKEETEGEKGDERILSHLATERGEGLIRKQYQIVWHTTVHVSFSMEYGIAGR